MWAEYPEQIIVHLENVANINVDTDSVIPREKKMGVLNIARRLLTTKMRQIKVLKKYEQNN